MPKAMTRAEVYSVLDSERDYQDMRIVRDGSTSAGEHFHTPEEYIVYIQHYLNDALETASTTWGPDCKPAVMDKLRKVGALVVAAIEDNGAPRRAGF